MRAWSTAGHRGASRATGLRSGSVALTRPPQPERLDAETGNPSRGPTRKLGQQSSTLGGATELRTRGDLPLDELVLLVAIAVRVDDPTRLSGAKEGGARTYPRLSLRRSTTAYVRRGSFAAALTIRS